MQAALLGRKIGMTQVYDEAGTLHPVTVVAAGPCYVTQIKTVALDGYDAVQLGFEPVRPHRASHPVIGHAAKSRTKPSGTYREVRLPEADPAIQLGAELTVATFADVGWVDVIGTTKGKGFAGVMKRHNFAGQPGSHGTERKHRSPGSIGSHGNERGGSGGPKKGKRMGGHMGDARCTSRNHKLVSVDQANGLLLIKGSVPGANGGLVFVRTSKTKRVAEKQ
jgi:large subunit ribosomal protein L3